MSEFFDPYHRWLGIPPKDQPPNHYRLLGIDLFEGNLDVIEAAADRQMGHLRTYQTGKHAELSQRLLNQVAAAKVCLLNPSKKASYDGGLRQKLQAEEVRLGDEKPALFVPPLAELFGATGRTAPSPPTPPPIQVPAVKRPSRRAILIASAIAGVLVLALVLWSVTGDEKPAGSSQSKVRPSTRMPSVASQKAGDTVGSPTRGSRTAGQASSDNTTAFAPATGRAERTPGPFQPRGHSASPFKPSRTVDLLQLIDLERDARRESGWPPWRREGGVLVLPPGNAQLEIPYSVPEEYDLTVVVRREGEGAVRPFVLMPVAGGTTFQIQFDYDALHKLCIANCDGRWTTITNQAVFEYGKASTIVCRIRRSGFSILVNGRLIADRKGSYRRYSPDPAFMPKDPSHPMIVSFTSTTFRISQLELTPVGSP